jgi:hypothetical protein
MEELARPAKPKFISTMDFEVKSFEEIMREKKRKLGNATDLTTDPKRPLVTGKKSNLETADPASKHIANSETLRPIGTSKPDSKRPSRTEEKVLKTSIPIEDDIDRQIAEIEELINS